MRTLAQVGMGWRGVHGGSAVRRSVDRWVSHSSWLLLPAARLTNNLTAGLQSWRRRARAVHRRNGTRPFTLQEARGCTWRYTYLLFASLDVSASLLCVCVCVFVCCVAFTRRVLTAERLNNIAQVVFTWTPRSTSGRCFRSPFHATTMCGRKSVVQVSE